MTGVHIKRGNLDADTHREQTVEDEGGDWGDAKGQLRDTKDGQQTTRNEGKGLEQILPAALRRNPPC